MEGKEKEPITMERLFKEVNELKILITYVIGCQAAIESILQANGKHFRMELIDDGTVEVTDILSGCSRNVNVELDNVPAMILDILKQAGDWIL